MATFAYGVSPGASLEKVPRVLLSKFGDGYEQRLGDGINLITRKWSISFISKTIAQADAIDAFFVARNGIEAFNWTPPSGIPGVWICRTWNRREDTFNTSTITTVFEEVFGEIIAP